MNKHNTKQQLAGSGVPMAQSVLLLKGENVDREKLLNMGLPLFVKPNTLGSSFGVTKVKTAAELLPAVEAAFEYDTEVVVESFLAGREFSNGVVRFNGEGNPGLYARVAQALDLVPNDNPAEQVAAWLEDFNKKLGITQRLRDVGIPREALPKLSEKAMADGCHLTNPRPCTLADMQRLYEASW